jgi:hypothetical protein
MHYKRDNIFGKLTNHAGIGVALPIFLASCFYVFCLYFWLGGVFVVNNHAQIVPLRLPSWDEMKWWLGRPDTAWYFSIMEGGYKAAQYSSTSQANWAFFPAYPLLVRFLSQGFSREGTLAIGWFISLVFYALATWLFCLLLLMDYTKEIVTRSLILLCFYPFAFSLMTFGPDSLLLLSACAAIYFGRQGNWLLAGLSAGIASATRIQGVLLVPCVLYMYSREKHFQWRRFDRSCLGLLIAPSGLIAFAVYLWHLTGNPLAFAGIQAAWGNEIAYPFAFLVDFLREPAVVAHSGWDPALFSVVATCALAPLLFWSWKSGQVPVEYSIFFSLQFLVLTCRTSTLGNLRYITGCFPFFLILGIVAKRQMVFSLLLALFAGFLGIFAVLFSSSHQLGYNFVIF